jgi:hypothetical protein
MPAALHELKSANSAPSGTFCVVLTGVRHDTVPVRASVLIQSRGAWYVMVLVMFFSKGRVVMSLELACLGRWAFVSPVRPVGSRAIDCHISLLSLEYPITLCCTLNRSLVRSAITPHFRRRARPRSLLVL